MLWAAHSYNVAFSDEIGHFEYCNAITSVRRQLQGGQLPRRHRSRPVTATTRRCFPYPMVNPAGAILIRSLTGCLATDNDFDGPEYHDGTWPGSPGAVASNVSTPIQFSSPLFTGPGNSGLRNYQQVAFETDLPRIEGTDFSETNNCQRHVSNPADPSPGSGCVNPPLGRAASRPSIRSSVRPPPRTVRASGKKAAPTSRVRPTPSGEPPPPSTVASCCRTIRRPGSPSPSGTTTSTTHSAPIPARHPAGKEVDLLARLWGGPQWRAAPRLWNALRTARSNVCEQRLAGRGLS